MFAVRKKDKLTVRKKQVTTRTTTLIIRFVPSEQEGRLERRFVDVAIESPRGKGSPVSILRACIESMIFLAAWAPEHIAGDLVTLIDRWDELHFFRFLLFGLSRVHVGYRQPSDDSTGLPGFQPCGELTITPLAFFFMVSPLQRLPSGVSRQRHK